MTHMKYPAATLFVVVMLLFAAGCGRGAEPGAQGPPAAAPAAQATPAAADDMVEPDTATAKLLEPWTGDLDGMVERRYIRVLVTYSRTNYFLDKGHQKGITYEAGRLFDDFLNKRLKTKIRVKVVFIPMRRDLIPKALADGRGDIVAGGVHVRSDMQDIASFAAPWTSGINELVVLGSSEPAVTDVSDLGGREVHVRRSSIYWQSLTALNQKLTAAGKPPVRIIPADEQLEDDDILEMVNAGLIPATVVDSHTAALWGQIFPEIRVQPVAVRTGDQIAWAVRKGALQLLEAVNAFVATNAQGSANYNVIYKRYFQDAKWIRNAAAGADRQRFTDTVALFRRYGDQYDLPWLLVAAQAYQESQIDQSRKSSVGAVGVMQIKPSTAEGPPVFIKGVDTSVERNIEAGTKYLRFIADQYYKDEPMTRVNKGLFAIASYNAGPARIAQLRKKAEQRGFDPNVWFGNVEVIAAQEIGRETVDYVSNIYKYYVSYQLMMRQREARDRAMQR